MLSSLKNTKLFLCTITCQLFFFLLANSIMSFLHLFLGYFSPQAESLLLLKEKNTASFSWSYKQYAGCCIIFSVTSATAAKGLNINKMNNQPLRVSQSKCVYDLFFSKTLSGRSSYCLIHLCIIQT